jgi:hypothetical protein
LNLGQEEAGLRSYFMFHRQSIKALYCKQFPCGENESQVENQLTVFLLCKIIKYVVTMLVCGTA